MGLAHARPNNWGSLTLAPITSAFMRTVFTVRKRDKTFNAYSGCSLCPTLFYLGYVLDPGSLSLLFFVRCPQLSQNRRYSGNAIDRCRNPAHQGESCWNLHILRKVWLIFRYALLEGIDYTLAFAPCLKFTCNRRYRSKSLAAYSRRR